MTVRGFVGPLSFIVLGLAAGCEPEDTGGKDTSDTGTIVDTDTGDTADTACADTGATVYEDADQDGVGAGIAYTPCDTPPAHPVEQDGDCDDTNNAIFPGATEVCNNADDNCDGTMDEGLGETWYADADGDTYGDPLVPLYACTAPAGYVADTSDCDDTDNHVNPAADELCSGVDDDCDGVVDLPNTALYVDSAGSRFDVSGPLAAGSAGNPSYIGDQAGYSVEVTSGTVYLCEGTWHTKIVLAGLGSDLTVVGRAGAALTTLTTGGTTGGDDGSVIAVTGAALTVRGLTITGGIGSEDNTKGGGVAVTQSGSLSATPNATFYDSIITGNLTDYGGGIALLDYGTVALHDTWVTNNTANSVGGGVWVQDHGELSCEATTVGGGGFTKNAAPIAGGFYFSSKSNGILDSAGCDWGNDGADDNTVDDIQRQPYYQNAWCFGNATATTDLVYCDSTGCTGTQLVTCP